MFMGVQDASSCNLMEVFQEYFYLGKCQLVILKVEVELVIVFKILLGYLQLSFE